MDGRSSRWSHSSAHDLPRWLFLLGLVVACSSSPAAGGSDAGTGSDSGEGGNASDTGPGVDAGDPDAAATAYAQAYCTRYAACDPSGIQINYGTLSACVSQVTTDEKLALAADGTSRTPNDLSTCAAGLGSIGCGAFLQGDRGATCIPTAPGQAADGAPCFDDGQCSSTYCNLGSRTSGNQPAYCGHCATRLATNDACTYSGDCPPPMDCPIATDKCTAYAPLPTENQACQSNQSPACDPGLVCSGSVCVKAGELGDPCGAGCDLWAPLQCTGGNCVVQSYCANNACLFPVWDPTQCAKY